VQAAHLVEAAAVSLRAASEMIGRHHSVLGKSELSEFIEYCSVIGDDPHDQLFKNIKTRVVGGSHIVIR
jgi:acyl-[acyl carrier protein]--UDP-N-acetylglucosamine O-acyltransferase